MTKNLKRILIVAVVFVGVAFLLKDQFKKDYRTAYGSTEHAEISQLANGNFKYQLEVESSDGDKRIISFESKGQIDRHSYLKVETVDDTLTQWSLVEAHQVPRRIRTQQ